MFILKKLKTTQGAAIQQDMLNNGFQVSTGINAGNALPEAMSVQERPTFGGGRITYGSDYKNI